MRELILKMTISVDGFVSDLEGGNRWMFGEDQEAKDWSAGFLWTAGLHIMGSRSFTAMAGWWPISEDAFAAPMNAIPKVVFSRQGVGILASAKAATVPGARVGRGPGWPGAIWPRKSDG